MKNWHMRRSDWKISIGDNPYKGNDIPMMVAKRDQVSDIIAL